MLLLLLVLITLLLLASISLFYFTLLRDRDRKSIAMAIEKDSQTHRVSQKGIGASTGLLVARRRAFFCSIDLRCIAVQFSHGFTAE